MGQRKYKTILFLCTGNYYRSRFAEVVFNSVADKLGLPWQASSRGLALERSVNNVGPMAVEAITALETLGVRAADVMTRFPAQVTSDDLERAALIVALKHAEHLLLLQERFPAWAEKVEFWHVDDAPGGAGPDRTGGHAPRGPHPGQGTGKSADRNPRPGTSRSKGAGQEACDREGRQGDGGPAWQGRDDGVRPALR